MTEHTPEPVDVPAEDTAQDAAALRPRNRAARTRRNIVIGVTAAAVVAAGVTAVLVIPQGTPTAAGTPTPVASIAASGPYRQLTVEQVDSLPEARYDHVIPGLLPATNVDPAAITSTATIAKDVAVYGDAQKAAVAHLSAKNFLGDPTVIVPIGTDGAWTKVLTPARVQLPSKAHGAAAAQSAGWVRTDQLSKGTALTARLVVSVSKQTLTITRDGQTVSYPVGVGTASTPTPTGVTGYLQARYLDPSQGESVYPIQLTTLHSTAKDEPFGGKDGGLIGVHYNTTTTGAVSHGCIRLTAAAIAAVNQVPLGTPISIEA